MSVMTRAAARLAPRNFPRWDFSRSYAWPISRGNDEKGSRHSCSRPVSVFVVVDSPVLPEAEYLHPALRNIYIYPVGLTQCDVDEDFNPLVLTQCS